MNGRRLPACAAGILLAASAATAQELTTPVPAAPAAPESVVARLVARGLGLPEPQDVATIDLDNDGFPEILAAGEGGTHILRLGDKAWRDIGNGQFAEVRAVGELRFNDRRFNGMPVITGAGVDYAFAAGAYQRLDAIAPAGFDLAAFQPACEASEDMAMILEENGAQASQAGELCACIATQWQARAPEQAFFETYVRELGGEYRESDRDERAEADTLISLIDEAIYDCKAARGWPVELPYPYGTPMFDGKPGSDNVAAFIETCAAQDWLPASKAVGTADRALGVCGCAASSLAASGMSAQGFDMIAALYSGERSENEINDEDPSAVAASDEAAGACVKALPYR